MPGPSPSASPPTPAVVSPDLHRCDWMAPCLRHLACVTFLMSWTSVSPGWKLWAPRMYHFPGACSRLLTSHSWSNRLPLEALFITQVCWLPVTLSTSLGCSASPTPSVPSLCPCSHLQTSHFLISLRICFQGKPGSDTAQPVTEPTAQGKWGQALHRQRWESTAVKSTGCGLDLPSLHLYRVTVSFEHVNRCKAPR